jgi:hypothetical protein
MLRAQMIRQEPTGIYAFLTPQASEPDGDLEQSEEMLTVMKFCDRRGSALSFSHLFANQPGT